MQTRQFAPPLESSPITNHRHGLSSHRKASKRLYSLDSSSCQNCHLKSYYFSSPVINSEKSSDDLKRLFAGPSVGCQLYWISFISAKTISTPPPLSSLGYFTPGAINRFLLKE
ncbi:hypothetical protein HA466_0179740 [Hirschfeldia incana]|nr:hypothetical protein HA466_0179740 [Hirschfeldia incana]